MKTMTNVVLQCTARAKWVWKCMFPKLRLCLAMPIVVFVASCGGGDGSGPAPWPKQTVSGMVVNNGKPVAGAEVNMYCSVGSGSSNLFFFTKTDSNGAFSKALDNAVAPCVLYSNLSNTTKLLSYVKNFTEGAATAHITPASDAMLSVMMGSSFHTEFFIDVTKALGKLGAQLNANADTAAWGAMREKLLTGPDFTDPTNVKAMVGDPVSGTLNTANATAPGYFGLLKNLYSNNLDSNWLWAYTTDEAQTVTGGVVINGAVVAKTTVHLTCIAGTQLNNYYEDTDSNGVFTARVSKTNTLCLVDAYDPGTEAYWFSFTKISGEGAAGTANVSALTDTMLALLFDGYDVGSMINKAGLVLLQTQLDQGADAAIWKTFRQNLISRPNFTQDVNAMVGDPMTSPLDTVTKPVPPGYFHLLQMLVGVSRAELLRIATGS